MLVGSECITGVRSGIKDEGIVLFKSCIDSHLDGEADSSRKGLAVH